jgi:excisionase family DNA binding protein
MSDVSRSSELLTVADVAEILRCSERHVYRLEEEGKMPKAIRPGSIVRWRRKAIEDWLDAGCPSQETIAVPAKPSPVMPPPMPLPDGSKKTKRRAQPQQSEKLGPSFGELLGIPDELLPRDPDNPNNLALSHAELQGIMQVDRNQLHGWLYLERDIPEEAKERLRSHFRAIQKP